MKYGYFDDLNQEYVIDNPATPAPWANYLGDPNYGAIISNNAGGYSFETSGASGRILRYGFNNFDEPGRYIYLKDDKDGDFWSLSWKPVQKDLKEYKSVCRHGTGYSTFISEYKNITSEVTYYVPLDKQYEVWYVKIRNNDNIDRKLTCSGYCEFTSDPYYEQDLINLQYSLFITKTEYSNNILRQLINENQMDINKDSVKQRFFALANAEVSSYCGDKNAFLGDYHYYRNPVGIIKGDLGNFDCFNYTACGALSTKIKIKAHQEVKLAFIMGNKNEEKARIVLDSYKDINTCEFELETLKKYWHSRFNNLQVKTPSKEFDSMINTWHPYNCFMTFTWSRAASLVYCGLRNGYGYRDTVQDIQGIIHLDPEAAKDKITFMLSAQVNNGAGLPLVKFNHNPGHEDTPDDESYRQQTGHPAYRADDALWLFPTIYKYLCETGDLKYLDKVIPYANKDKDNVYSHLKKAIDFSITHSGKHHMPAGLYADWNDCLRLGEKGESVFVAMQLYLAINIMEEFAEYKKDKDYLAFLKKERKQYQKILDKCFDNDRYIRGYSEKGKIIGNRESEEANMWLNHQSWAIISGLADKKTADIILDSVERILNTSYGAELMYPPLRKDLYDGYKAICYNAGNKENNSIFLQPQGWLILAESLNGNGNRAYRYYKESCPAYQNDNAEIRVMEPYCYGQFTEGRLSPKHGRSNVHWLTGTASTVMVGCVEGILGIRPDLYGLKLSPAIPDEWKHLEIDKIYRNKKLHIIINNQAKDKGLYLNGILQNRNYINEKDLLKDNEVIINL